MKNNQNAKTSKFLKNFEIGKGKQSNVLGGARTNPGGSAGASNGNITGFTIPGSEASSYACPDTKQDVW